MFLVHRGRSRQNEKTIHENTRNDTKCSLVAILLSLTLLFGACSRSTNNLEQVTIEPKVTPQPPLVGLVTIDFKLKEASGRPITGANAALEANMSHAGMSPVFADAKEIAPGDYRCPIEFSMAGDWVITVRITLSDGQKVERTFEVRGVRSD